jgi:hypothetical protein
VSGGGGLAKSMNSPNENYFNVYWITLETKMIWREHVQVRKRAGVAAKAGGRVTVRGTEKRQYGRTAYTARTRVQ